MPRIKLKIEWYGKTPRGAPTETVVVWPFYPENEEQVENFRAGVHEYLDDEWGQQPKTFAYERA